MIDAKQTRANLKQHNHMTIPYETSTIVGGNLYIILLLLLLND